MAAGSPGACDAVCARVLPHILRLALAGADPVSISIGVSDASVGTQHPDSSSSSSAVGASEGLTLAALHTLLRDVQDGLQEMPPPDGWRPFKVRTVIGVTD